MTDRDLRKMNRKELLELLIALEQENDQLKKHLQQQELQLQNRDIRIKGAGNLTEAAATLKDVFESTDRAAAQYLENIKYCIEQQESIYDKIVSEAEKKAKAILNNAENEKKQKMNEADAYWQYLKVKLETLYQNHPNLREHLMTQSHQRTGDNR